MEIHAAERTYETQGNSHEDWLEMLKIFPEIQQVTRKECQRCKSEGLPPPTLERIDEVLNEHFYGRYYWGVKRET